MAPDAELPVRVEGLGLINALRDAQWDIPVRASVERCGARDATPLAFDTWSTATPAATLDALLAAHLAAGGVAFERHTDQRVDGAWTRLQEPGCSVLDTPIDLDFEGDLEDALQPWADALAVATGESVRIPRGIRSGGDVRVHARGVPARTVLLQILDTNISDTLTWSYRVHRLTGDWNPAWVVDFSPVELYHGTIGSISRGPHRVVDGVYYPVEP